MKSHHPVITFRTRLRPEIDLQDIVSVVYRLDRLDRPGSAAWLEHLSWPAVEENVFL